MSAVATVHVVDDDAAMRRSIAFLAESVGWRTVTYDTAQRFLDEVTAGETGCLILDVRMPEMSGLELQREMRRRNLVLPVIFVTGHADVGLAVEAMKQGAFDFIEKPFRDQLLLDAIAKAVRASQLSLGVQQVRDASAQRLALLTPRERAVADLVARGHANREIALHLGISEKTVHVHRGRVMDKVEVRSAAELARVFMQVDPGFAHRRQAVVRTAGSGAFSEDSDPHR